MKRLALAWLLMAAGACHLIGGIEEATLQCPVNEEVDGFETDVDCGGPCAKCEDFKQCDVPEDCASNSCIFEEDDAPTGVCFPPLCFDGRVNGTESDADCGGFDSECRRCFGGEICREDTDCASVYFAEALGMSACQDGRCMQSCCFEDCDGCDELCVSQCCEQPDPYAACCTTAGCYEGGIGWTCDPAVTTDCVYPFMCREVLAGEFRCL